MARLVGYTDSAAGLSGLGSSITISGGTTVPVVGSWHRPGGTLVPVAGRDGTSIEVRGTVDTWADLPAGLGAADEGALYIVRADGLGYVWGGDAWPPDGEGIQIRGPKGDTGRGITTVQTAPGGFLVAYSDATSQTVPVPAVQAAEDDAAAAAASAAAAHDAEVAAAGSAAAADADAAQTGLDRQATGADATATAADRTQTGLDAQATGADAAATAADRVQTGLDAQATAADRTQTGLDATATAADRAATGQDAAAADGSATSAAQSAADADADATATAADRVQTGQDAQATAADRVAAGQAAADAAASAQAAADDAAQTALDRQATGADATATAADRVATGGDATATAADRVQTGLDRDAAAASALSASDDADRAEQAAANAETGAPAGGWTLTDLASPVQSSLAAADTASQPGHTHLISDVTGLQGELDGKSPVGHTHTTADVTGLQAAIDDAVAALVNGAPGALDTLNELAAALDNDPNFAATVNAEIGTKADKTYVDAGLAGKADTVHTHTASQISDASATGRGVLTGTAAQARSSIGVPALADMQALVEQYRPAGITHSGTGPPPTTIPGAKVGDWWLDEATMDYYKITGI
ncbi:hypothetical protein [Tomitella gaofuii]|uniref:hypothetical protein n=1 Tax=Tomitella gaofuii TaxID=2760083 RepID=UPI0015FDDBB5|nr:hypothetical protein [Tomitella gaofuii]